GRENNVFPIQRQYFIGTCQPKQMVMFEPLRVGCIAVETRLAPASSCRRARPESVSPTRRSEASATRTALFADSGPDGVATVGYIRTGPDGVATPAHSCDQDFRW